MKRTVIQAMAALAALGLTSMSATAGSFFHAPASIIQVQNPHDNYGARNHLASKAGITPDEARTLPLPFLTALAHNSFESRPRSRIHIGADEILGSHAEARMAADALRYGGSNVAVAKGPAGFRTMVTPHCVTDLDANHGANRSLARAAGVPPEIACRLTVSELAELKFIRDGSRED